jgi:hypothetical protein
MPAKTRATAAADTPRKGALGKAKGYIKGLLPVVSRVESKRKMKRRKQLEAAHQLAKRRAAEGSTAVSAHSLPYSDERGNSVSSPPTRIPVRPIRNELDLTIG